MNSPITHAWRDDITGLRALAVLPVLLYHAFPNLLAGGFFGVDIFFVISGYLISGIVFRNIRAGTFSYLDFYDRRVRRIIPNLLLVFCFVSICGYIIFLPYEYYDLGRHLYSSAGFYQNFRLLHETGYFTEDALRQPLLHLWSLAIEEQFYIVFPLVCVGIWKCTKRIQIIGIFVACICAGSLALCLLSPDKNYCFYFPFTRFWEIGIGIIVSYLEINTQVLEEYKLRRHGNVFSIIGFFLIIWAMSSYSRGLNHPGIVTLAPVLGSALIILSGRDGLINRTLLSWRPITYTGLISYSLYLWHWPILSFLFICHPDSSWYISTLALFLSWLVSHLVYVFIENPARKCRVLFNKPLSVILLILLALSFAYGQCVRKTDGFATRSFSMLPISWNGFRIDFERIPKEDSSFYYNENSKLPNIMIAGDSHAEQYYSRVRFLSRNTGKSFSMMVGGDCFIFSDLCGSTSESCNKARKTFQRFVSNTKQDRVLLISMKWGHYSLQKDHFESSLLRFKSEVSTQKNLRVIIVLDYPWDEYGDKQGNFDPVKHINRFSPKKSNFIVDYPDNKSWKIGNDIVSRILGDVVEIVKTEDFVCENGKCDLLKWYRDDDHLKSSAVEKYATWIDRAFE